MVKAFSAGEFFTLYNYLDMALRLLLAGVCGALIGLERERRSKNAGLRTHIITAMAASLLMIISKYGFFDVIMLGSDISTRVDVSRIGAGVIQSIGFLCAGVIYAKKEGISGLTTAAGLWATVGIGMCFGSGLYIVGACTTLAILLVLLVLRFHHNKRNVATCGNISCNLTKNNISIQEISDRFSEFGAKLRDISMETHENGDRVLKAEIVFNYSKTLLDYANILKDTEYIDSFELYPAST